MRIAITGSSGLIGSAVSDRLRAAGHTITRMVRSRAAAAEPDAIYWSPSAGEVDAEGLGGHDAVVNLAGENIFGVWTDAKKQRIYHSRVDGTALLARTLAALPEEDRPGTLINASAVGYYGRRPPDEPLEEGASPGDGFMARVVRDWEGAADPAREAGVRVVHLRFAPVLDPDGLLLKAMALASRVGLGAKLGSGRQAFPWVTRDEIGRIVPFALDHDDVAGPVNVAAPERVTNEQFSDAVARIFGRPRFLAVPALALRMIGDLGDELMTGAWVVPRKLEEAGYAWREPELEPALRRMLK